MCVLPGLCGIRVSGCVWHVACPGLMVGGGVLRLGEEEGGLAPAVLPWCLCVAAGVWSAASRSEDMRPRV